MVIYSITDLEKLSGVKAHTLRIWEKRYGIIKPQRTQTNIRYYLDDDLKQVLNIAFLNKKGWKISKIASMGQEEIRRKVLEYSDINEGPDDQLDALTLCVLEMNGTKFTRILDRNIEQNGFEVTINDVIYPLLDKLGIMWISGSIKGVHERFVTFIVRCKIIYAINQLKVEPSQASPSFLIYLPEGEHHELSLLYLDYILRSRGVNIMNLGTQISVDLLIEGYEACHPDYVFTIINDTLEGSKLQTYVNHLCSNMPNSHFLFSGYKIISEVIDLPKNAQKVNGLAEVKNLVNSLLERN